MLFKMESVLVGNTGIKSSVTAMLEGDRLPHAVIIEGENGLGKHTLAAFIAAGAVCTGKTHPCGECRDCHLAQIGSHPDITYYPGEGKYSVDKVRDIRQEMYLMPHMAKRRVFVFEDADTLSPAAQNALLKVIEEPPAFALMLFLLPAASALLETVRSRCITFTLSPPPIQQAAAYICGKIGCTDEEAKSALEAASGNIGVALAQLCDGEVGGDDRLAEDILAFAGKNDAYGMLKQLYSCDKDRQKTARLFDSLKKAVCRKIKENGISPETGVKLYGKIDFLSGELEYNCNLRLLFTNTCIALTDCFK